MNSIDSFALFDCSLARYGIGRSCSNLRELLEAVRLVPDMVLEHHMMRCALEDYFELYEFPNDLARWCWEALGDHLLAEEFSLIDPYSLPSIQSLRMTLVNMIEERLWGMETMHDCRPGFELHLVGSRLVAYDTGERFTTPAALAEALPRMSVRSLFYHVHEAHRRRQPPTDDISEWLEKYGADPAVIARLRKIDFNCLNLNQLRAELVEAVRQPQQPEPQATVRATA